MGLFHQSSHQLNTQIKVFPVRLNDLHFLNVTLEDRSEYQLSDSGFSFVAFLPVVVIGVLLAILIVFIKLRSLRTDRDQMDRLDHVYRILEYVDQVSADPYDDPELVRTIRSVLLSDEDDERTSLQTRKNSYLPREYQFQLKSDNHCQLDDKWEPPTRVSVDQNV